MAENDSQQLPSFASLDDLVEFFDTHDMGEYEEALPEAHFEVDLKRKAHFVAIDEETNSRLTEIAELERTPAESLVKFVAERKDLTLPVSERNCQSSAFPKTKGAEINSLRLFPG